MTGRNDGGDGFDVRSLSIICRDGHRLGDHTHPWAQLVYALSGLMSLEAEGSTWFVPPTRAIWIPPRVPHRIAFRGEVALHTLYISSQRANGVRRALEAFEVSPLLSELIVHILSQKMLDPRLPAHDRLAGVLVDLISAAPGLDLAPPLPRDERALRLAERLRSDPGERRDLQDLAVESGASLRTLQRCFSEETGFSIEAWRQKARLIHAAAALASGASMTAAAFDCGYDSASAFIAAFRKQFGVTPGKFQGG